VLKHRWYLEPPVKPNGAILSQAASV